MKKTKRTFAVLGLSLALLVCALPAMAATPEEEQPASGEEIILSDEVGNTDSETETEPVPEEDAPHSSPIQPAADEGVQPFAATIPVTSYAGLRDEIAAANDGDTIQVMNNITLEDTIDLSGAKELTIEGVGADITLTAPAGKRHFSGEVGGLPRGTLTMKNLTLDGGGDGGGLSLRLIDTTLRDITVQNCSLENASALYFKTCDVEMYDCVVTQNKFVRTQSGGFPGGAIVVTTVANLLMDGCLVSHNETVNAAGEPTGAGGGINGQTENGSGPRRVELRSTVLEYNSATSGGGVYMEYGQLIADADTIIRHNTASSDGGGIRLSVYKSGSSPALILNGTQVLDNSANAGAGIYTSYSRAVLNGAVIKGNVATGHGGGIYTGVLSTNGNTECIVPELTLTGGTRIEENRAISGGGVYSVGVLEADHTYIGGNRTTSAGGGLYIADGAGGRTPDIAARATLRACEINDNQVSGNGNVLRGGGIYHSDNIPLTFAADDASESTKITNNLASAGGGISTTEHASIEADYLYFSGNHSLTATRIAPDSALAATHSTNMRNTLGLSAPFVAGQDYAYNNYDVYSVLTTSSMVFYSSNHNNGSPSVVGKTHDIRFTPREHVVLDITDLGFTHGDDVRFVGWNTKQDGSGIPYPVGTTVPEDVKNLSLYAQWAPATVSAAPSVNPYTEGDAHLTGRGVAGATISFAFATRAPVTATVQGDGTWSLPVAESYGLKAGVSFTVAQTETGKGISPAVTVTVLAPATGNTGGQNTGITTPGVATGDTAGSTSALYAVAACSAGALTLLLLVLRRRRAR